MGDVLMQQGATTAAYRRVPVYLVDQTDGLAPETGVTGTGRISKNGGASAATTNSLVEVDSTNMPGTYYLELTAAELDTLGWIDVYVDTGATAPYRCRIYVVPYDPYATAPDVNVTQWRGSTPNNLTSGRVDTTVGAMQADVVTASAIATDAIGASELAADAASEIATAVWAAVRASNNTAGSFGERVNADVTRWQTGTPNALVSGRVDSTVGAMQADTLTASALATDAVTELTNAIKAIALGDSTLTWNQVLGVVVAALAGKLSGGGTATEIVRNIADTLNRISYTVDAAGNRTAVTLTLTGL